MRHGALPLYAALALASLIGCASTNGGGVGTVPPTYNTDGGADSAAPTDGGATSDAGVVDAGAVDTGAKDVAADASKPDAGPVDAGKPDAAVPDTGGGAQSCQGKCMAAYNPSLPCQCNDQCPKYGNCCKDWDALCKPKLNSCIGRCGKPFDSSKPCQCRWDCGKSGSCCADYLGVCQADTNLDHIFATEKECGLQGAWYGVKQTKDGDTLVLTNGEIVRLLIVNTPEIKTADCYAKDASSFTYKTVKKVGIVCLVKDPNQPNKDQYDRLLRYVYFKEAATGNKAVQLNARLVRLGYGPVFYPYAKGNAHEQISVLMQQKARQEKVGGWGACSWQ